MFYLYVFEFQEMLQFNDTNILINLTLSNMTQFIENLYFEIRVLFWCKHCFFGGFILIFENMYAYTFV
mgnify:CR=1 FL=1